MHPSDLAQQTAPIISSREMDEVMKIVQSFEESSLLIKDVVSKTIEKEAKEQKSGCFSMILGTLAASSLRKLLAGKGIIQAGELVRFFSATSSFN